MTDDDLPTDPFVEVSTIASDAIWLMEHYASCLDAGFTKRQAMRLVRDHLRWSYYPPPWWAGDADDEELSDE